MANVILKKVEGWLKRQAFQAKKEDGKLVKVTMHVVTPNTKLGPEVLSISPGENLEPDAGLTDDMVEGYASDLFNEACEYADGVGQTTTFMLAAFFEEDEHNAKARHPFTIRNENPEAVDGEVSTEPATQSGLVKQLMRHNESMARIMMGSIAQTQGTLIKQNEVLAKMAEQGMEDKADLLQAFETLASAKHDREIELRKLESAEKAKGAIVEQAVALLPAVANKFIGHKILKENATPMEQLLVKAAETWTQPQIDAMLKTMSTEQQIAFIELLQGLRPDDKKEG